MNKQVIRLILIGMALAHTAPTWAQSTTADYFSCGDIPQPSDSPVIEPKYRGNAGLNDAGFDCMAWQDFIYLNWPVSSERGVPDTNARFGATGRTTVWESYKTAGEVFLPFAMDPGPWDDAQLLARLQGENSSLIQQVDQGDIRHLTQSTKISLEGRAALSGAESGFLPTVLQDTVQAGGGSLYDLNGEAVFYEILMNKGMYKYIVDNGLYNANTQAEFVKTNVIDLKTGDDGETNSSELKVAWKVLTESEITSGRFHTNEALIYPSYELVTVGLVGFHMFIANGTQGGWASFQQVDNAPQGTAATSGSFNFFNPDCKVGNDPCPVNVKDANPGQVLQITPNDPTAVSLNEYVHKMIKAYDPNSPWQYYDLINVQWPTNPVALSSLKTPANAPLPDGKPNTDTMVNPVMETFQQKEGTGCFSCHVYAQTSKASGLPQAAAGYSFIFGRASAPLVD